MFNKKHSEETKRKMSLTRKGMIPWNKGLRGDPACSQETREKKRKANLGKEGRKGSNNPRWIDGRSLNRKYYLRKLRKDTLEVLGGKCIKCDFQDKRALQIDHVNGNGRKDRRERGSNNMRYYRKVTESFLNKENKFQLLCANCNWIKRVENKES